MTIGNNMLSESKFFMGYSRWDDATNKYETWGESVDRVMNMHREKYSKVMTPELENYFKLAENAYKDQLVLGAQRALQFGGEQLFKHESRLYNCSVSYIDRPEFFNECLYLMLSGCGVGFSVQYRHINKLPTIARRSQKRAKIFQVPDTIEGWSDAIAVLLSSYFTEGGTHPEYRGCQVHFDFTKIRPEGSKISGGFKAPGPNGLRKALVECEDLLENVLLDKPVVKLNSITVYDIVMHLSDAVLSGGVRRSATICVFDKDDKDMLSAKTGDWFINNPQRGRSNNSALIVREDLTREEWATIMKSVKDFGEPGFIFTDSYDFLFNPCVTGDTLVTVRDHNLTVDGETVAEGGSYNIRMDMLVDLFNTSGGDMTLCPMVLSVNTETGQKCWSMLQGAALTRTNAEIFEITDVVSGKSVKATADHLIWTVNRGYIKVCDLIETDVLMIN